MSRAVSQIRIIMDQRTLQFYEDTVVRKVTMMTDIEAINNRHSVRSYLDKAIEADKVNALNALIAECNEKGNLQRQECAGSHRTGGASGDRYRDWLRKGFRKTP